MLAAILLLPASARAEQVKALSAAEFRDSIGVVTHASYYETAYGDWSRLVAKLDDLGIDHVREGMYANPDWRDWNERFYRAIELGASHGKVFSFVMGEPHFRGGTIDQLIDVVAGRLRHAAAVFEGPNEYDLFHPNDNWPAELREYQRELYRKLKAHPSLRDVPVMAPSIVFLEGKQQVGSLEDALDLGNIHPYSGGQPPGVAARGVLGDARITSGMKPVMVTETGYHNALAAQHGQPPVPEDVGASYTVKTFLEHFRIGIVRTYVYELIDWKPDIALLEPEYHFGLLRNDFSEKPAFTALQRMLDLIGRARHVAPGAIDLGFTGDTSGVQRLLLQKSDRRFTLVLWQSASEWDQNGRRPLWVPDRDVMVDLPGEADVTMSRPARVPGSTELRDQRKVPVTVPADPVFVDLQFDTPPPGAVPKRAPTGDETGGGQPGPTRTCPKPRMKGLALRATLAEARFRGRRARRKTVKFELCSTSDGRATIEIATRGKRPRVLVRRKLKLVAGRSALGSVRWRRGGVRRRVTARVRYRSAGAAKTDVLAGRLVLPR